jgi:hypothetical protein
MRPPSASLAVSPRLVTRLAAFVQVFQNETGIAEGIPKRRARLYCDIVSLRGDVRIFQTDLTGKPVHKRATPSPSSEVKIGEGRTYELLRNSVLDSVVSTD